MENATTGNSQAGWFTGIIHHIIHTDNSSSSETLNLRDVWRTVSMAQILQVSLGLFVIYFLTSAFYNLYLHPLAHIPGPREAAISRSWYGRHAFAGTLPQDLYALHRKYGRVVRTAPNTLSFASATSYKEIYGFHPTATRPPFIKTAFYDAMSPQPPSMRHKSILLERSVEAHGETRRLLSHAFSARALSEQEPLVRQFVDRFMEKIGEHGQNDGGMDMDHWFTFFTFDVIGKLSLGESFHCMEEGKPHFWVDFLMNLFIANVAIDFMSSYPKLLAAIRACLPSLGKAIKRQKQYSYEMIGKRISNAANIKDRDFMAYILENKNHESFTLNELAASASSVILAGSETMSTFFTVAVYYLAKHPDVYNKLCDEIRKSYRDVSEINVTNATKLPYLTAVIQECLRICPPVSAGLPRLSPGATVDGIWVPEGTEVSTHNWSVTHDPEYFADPFKFDPERWLNPECTDNKAASQPFSLGARGCLGINLAWMEMRLVLSTMIYQYDFELVNPSLDWNKEVKNYIVWMKPTMKVRFRPVQRT